MSICAMGPADQRAQAKAVGNDLLQHYGKKRFYSVEEVRYANRRQNVSVDCACWSHAFFNSAPDFIELHRTLGQVCDYASMRAEMVRALLENDASSSWFDVDLSWLEWPDIDLSAIFDSFDIF